MSGKPLGRGISALIGENQYAGTAMRAGAGIKSGGIAILPVDKLSPGSIQPRQRFGEEELNNLAESIRKNGIVQPIIARGAGNDSYEIIAGERRWRAAKIAGLTEVPVIVRVLSDREALEVALIENIQRQDLTPLEIAEGYSRLIDQFEYTQEGLAEAVGKSRSHITNQLRLLTLPDEVKALLNENKLSAGHARALVGLEHATTLAIKIVKQGLNVRQTEKLAQKYADPSGRIPMPRTPYLQDTARKAERSLTHILGMPVRFTMKSPGKGTVAISYQNSGDLDRLLGLLYSYENRREKAEPAMETIPA